MKPRLDNVYPNLFGRAAYVNQIITKKTAVSPCKKVTIQTNARRFAFEPRENENQLTAHKNNNTITSAKNLASLIG